MLFGGNMREKEVLTNEYDEFIKEDFVLEDLLHAINNDEISELYFDWKMFTNEGIEKINKLLENCLQINKPIKFIIRINKFRDFDLLNLEKYSGGNIEFSFAFNAFGYTYKEFMDMNSKLDSLLKDVYPSMTPYEKYQIIYDRVRHFKAYRIVENTNTDLATILNSKYQSCNLKYILDNEYIDCLGYSLLLEILLNKVDIGASEFGFSVFDNQGNFIGGHARTLINLDDDKYNIHGIFVSDATWDNGDELHFSLLPLSSMKASIYGSCDETVLFDADNIDNISDVINRLKVPYRIAPRDYIIWIINKLDRNESEKLLKLDNQKFNEELIQYIHRRVNQQEKTNSNSYKK